MCVAGSQAVMLSGCHAVCLSASSRRPLPLPLPSAALSRLSCSHWHDWEWHGHLRHTLHSTDTTTGIMIVCTCRLVYATLYPLGIMILSFTLWYPDWVLVYQNKWYPRLCGTHCVLDEVTVNEGSNLIIAIMKHKFTNRILNIKE